MIILLNSSVVETLNGAGRRPARIRRIDLSQELRLTENREPQPPSAVGIDLGGRGVNRTTDYRPLFFNMRTGNCESSQSGRRGTPSGRALALIAPCLPWLKMKNPQSATVAREREIE